MTQLHLRHRVGHAPRLVLVQRQRLARLHVAELARPGADVAHQQEGRDAAAPAFAQVGAERLLADGVQRLAAHQRFQLPVLSFWFSLTRSHSGLRPVVGCSSCSRARRTVGAGLGSRGIGSIVILVCITHSTTLVAPANSYSIRLGCSTCKEASRTSIETMLSRSIVVQNHAWLLLIALHDRGFTQNNCQDVGPGIIYDSHLKQPPLPAPSTPALER